MEISKMIVGVDSAKRVFHLYWVDMETGEEVNLKLSQAKFLRHFAKFVPCLLAMEACGGSQHWARESYLSILLICGISDQERNRAFQICSCLLSSVSGMYHAAHITTRPRSSFSRD